MVANMVLRPQRNKYPELNMDTPEKRNYHGKEYNLESFYVKNKNGQKLSCSFLHPSAKYDEKMPTVIYMHGNAGNKLEGL